MRTAQEMFTKDRGRFRILIEGPAPDGRNQYFEVTYASAAPGELGITLRPEIIWVRDSRIAYNVALRKYGRNLLNITNLETGRLVVGATR